MVQKAAEAKLLRKAQRQAALDAAKMAKRERGYLRLISTVVSNFIEWFSTECRK